MTLDKQVAAKLAFEPGDKRKLEEIWVTVEKTVRAMPFYTPALDRIARAAFNQAYLEYGIKGPLATTALGAVGL